MSFPFHRWETAAQNGDVTGPECELWSKLRESLDFSLRLSDSQGTFLSTLMSQSPPRSYPEFLGIALHRALLARLSETEGWGGDQEWENY